jgi:hypothetical protein
MLWALLGEPQYFRGLIDTAFWSDGLVEQRRRD